MTDLPIFTTNDGIATLILHEIPYRGEGYILVRSVFGTLDGLLHECASFCRGAGAQVVYAGGVGDFSGYRVHAQLMQRRIHCADLPKSDAQVVAVTPKTATLWMQNYNARFRNVPAAQTCSEFEAHRLPEKNEAFFVYDAEECIGLGRIKDDNLLAIASLQPGAGERTLYALAQHSKQESLQLLCAVENLPAMRFYDRLGFSHGELREIWYEISPLHHC